MKIEGLGPPQQPEPNNKEADEAKKALNPAEAAKSEPDRIDLSRSDKNQGGIYTNDLRRGAGAVEQGPKDLDKVKRQTDSGYYDTPQAKTETSAKLIDSGDLSEVVEDYHRSNLAGETRPETADARVDKITEMKKKAASGFFNDPANFGAFADRIMRRFGL